MRVLLRNSGIGLWQVFRKHWDGNRDAAANLETIERAVELTHNENLEQMEIFVDDDDPTCQVVIPVKTRSAQGQPHGK